jgi:hypothetical protein
MTFDEINLYCLALTTIILLAGIVLTVIAIVVEWRNL